MRRSLKLSIVAIMATAFLASCGGVKVGTTTIFKKAKLDEALAASYYVSATEGFTISETDITVDQTVAGEEFSGGTELLTKIAGLDSKGKFKISENTDAKFKLTFTTGTAIAKDTKVFGSHVTKEIAEKAEITIELTKDDTKIKIVIAGLATDAITIEGSKTKAAGGDTFDFSSVTADGTKAAMSPIGKTELVDAFKAIGTALGTTKKFTIGAAGTATITFSTTAIPTIVAGSGGATALAGATVSHAAVLRTDKVVTIHWGSAAGTVVGTLVIDGADGTTTFGDAAAAAAAVTDAGWSA